VCTVTSPDGTSIDYSRYGAGPPVVFVAGATAYRAIDENATQAARRLATAGFMTIEYDRRGRGRSGNTRPWAADREVEDLAALIKEAGGAAALYAESSGAGIALAAAGAGTGVTALALQEPPFFSGHDLTSDLDALESLLAGGNNDEAMRYHLTSVIGLPADMVEGMSHGPRWAAMAAVAPTLIYDLTIVNQVNLDQDWRARWAAVSAPAIVCSGDQSFPGLREAADAVAAALPDASRRTLAGQGHKPAPDAIVPALRDFLKP
jgi:pimeloyl-ACP methyl ester carboxylesterase